MRETAYGWFVVTKPDGCSARAGAASSETTKPMARVTGRMSPRLLVLISAFVWLTVLAFALADFITVSFCCGGKTPRSVRRVIVDVFVFATSGRPFVP